MTEERQDQTDLEQEMAEEGASPEEAAPAEAQESISAKQPAGGCERGWTVAVVAGSSVAVPLSAQNLSASDGAFELAGRGIPSVWASVPAPVLRVRAGGQGQVSLTIQPLTWVPQRLYISRRRWWRRWQNE